MTVDNEGKLVKETKDNDIGYKKPPNPGPGRPKGSKNKFTELKEAFLEAFEELGGADGLVEWAKKSPRNQGMFYQMVAKMLPSNLSVEGNLSFTFELSDKYLPKDVQKK